MWEAPAGRTAYDYGSQGFAEHNFKVSDGKADWTIAAEEQCSRVRAKSHDLRAVWVVLFIDWKGYSIRITLPTGFARRQARRERV